MTETPEPDAVEPTEADVKPPAPADTPDKPDREAAKYRRQLRETEARETALSSRLEVMQRREVERIAAAHLTTPEDLWLAGADLAQLLNDDGDVDTDKVSAAVTEVLDKRPGWKRPAPPPSFDGGARQMLRQPAKWEDVLRGGRRP